MTGPMSILQIIADEVERRAIAIARAEHSEGEGADWPWRVTQAEAHDYREAVVRSMFAFIDKERV